MLNLFIKLWGQALHLTPTFIIEPFSFALNQKEHISHTIFPPNIYFFYILCYPNVDNGRMGVFLHFSEALTRKDDLLASG